jgi:signal transduction histidine kinase/PAS domain-containing protein
MDDDRNSARESLEARPDSQVLGAAHAPDRLRHLYAISKLLAAFRSVEQTIPAVLEIADAAVPLRSAVLIMTREGGVRVLAWRTPDPERHRALVAHATSCHAYFAGAAPAGTLYDPTTPLPASPGAGAQLIALPLVVDHERPFGVLQIETTADDEPALSFVSTVASLVAVALDRHAAWRLETARRQQAEAEWARAEAAELRGQVVTAALRESEERHRLALDATGLGAWDYDPVTGLSRCDAVCCALFGVPPTPVVTAEVIEAAVHPDDRARRLDVLERAFDPASGGDYRIDLRMVGLVDRVERWAQIRGRVHFEGGRAVRMLGTMLDITARQREEEGQRFLAEAGALLAGSLQHDETLASMARLAIRFLADWCVVDIVEDDGELVRAVIACADPDRRALADGFAPARIDPRGPYAARAAMESRRTVLVADLSPAFLASIAANDAHLRLLERVGGRSLLTVPLLARGRVLGAMVYISSRPGRRYGPVEARLAEDLSRLAALALDNACLYRTAQRAIRDRAEVLAMVAHDLRDPLHSVELAAGMIRQRAPAAEAACVGDLTGRIGRATGRMKRLVEDLLDVTRIEGGQLTVRPGRQAPAELVAAAVEAAEAGAAAASLALEAAAAGGLPDVLADRDRILQVFSNLISNALKFSAPGSRVRVGAARDGKGDVEFQVADTGPGISPEGLQHLFDRFWQARAGDRRGAGLGLPICKGIVQAHGATLRVESEPGRGSRFFFSLRAAP